MTPTGRDVGAAADGATPIEGRTSVSVVIPHLDRWDSLVATVESVLSLARRRGWSTQVVVVCDASPDAAWSRVVELAREHPPVEAIRLDRRSWALNARAVGMLVSRGEVVAMLDDDLEVDPQELGGLVDAVLEGADLASAVRGTGPRPASRRAGSSIVGLLARTLRGRPSDVSSGMKALSQQHCAAVLAPWPRIRDIRFALRMYQLAGRLVEVPVERRLTSSRSHHGPTVLLASMVDTALMLVGPSRWGSRTVVLAVSLAARLLATSCPPGRARTALIRSSELVAATVCTDLLLGARSPVPSVLEWTDGSSCSVLHRRDLGRTIQPP